jgi:NAD(P)-dependent dehydrogenase (short-subunit alcohol dehydrogenase family)
VAARLARLGGTVVVAARAVADDLPARLDPTAYAATIRLDLADLDQVAAATDRLVTSVVPRRFELAVLNAGVAPRRISASAQGHELAFAVNVLGHYVMFERLRRAGALAPGARVIVVTGDILMVARNCSADFASEHPRAGMMAYARSKLGSLWLATELSRRHPELHVVAVHPGVVRSGLGGPMKPRLWHRLTQITPERSSEAVLAAAFDSEVPSGGYVHNTLGLVRLDDADIAADRDRAAAFVEMLDELAAPWLIGAGKPT